jgi:hypothetical protein
MDSFNLKTASTYVNNLLLARGLLRNGVHIEFARPSKGDGGAEATMARIINLVHDMILKRDVSSYEHDDLIQGLNFVQREQEQRENFAQTLRTLRIEANRSTVTIERLEAKNEELSRQLAICQSQERSAKATLGTAETSARTLREEMAKLKASVQQIRASCANDIRKRDLQIQKLKSHLTEQQRGIKSGLVGASITISPGLNPPNGRNKIQREDESPDINDPAYSLKQETTEFLTQLSQSLSDENDNLIGLVRDTLLTLKELQGLPVNAQGIGVTTRSGFAGESETGSDMLQVLPTSYDSLSKDMENVLQNLKSILTNPNYVPIEEVAHREEEIMRLKEGWEKMEARWREAIILMDSWRTRMLNGGDTINLEEIKMGLGLAEGINLARYTTSSADSSDSMIDEHTEELDEGNSLESETYDSSSVDIVPEANDSETLTGSGIHGRSQTVLDALREANGNSSKSPRKVAFSTVQAVDENTSEVDLIPITNTSSSSKHPPKSPYHFHPLTITLDEKKQPPPKSQDSPSKKSKSKVRFTPSVIAATPHADDSGHDSQGADGKPNRARSPVSCHSPSNPNLIVNPALSTLLPLTYIYIDPLQNLKRLSSPSSHPEERSPKLTVQEKLNVAQAEAEAAAVAAGLKLDDIEVKFEDGFGKMGWGNGGSPIKKTRIGGRPKRRKSTLTPDELEALMFG